MSAREVIAGAIHQHKTDTLADCQWPAERTLERLLRMPLSDCLALMRALAPDGWVVARVPAQCGQLDADPRLSAGAAIAWADGWNACRAEVLASGEDGR